MCGFFVKSHRVGTTFLTPVKVNCEEQLAVQWLWRLLITFETWVQSQAYACGFPCRQSVTDTGVISLRHFGFLYQYHIS